MALAFVQHVADAGNLTVVGTHFFSPHVGSSGRCLIAHAFWNSDETVTVTDDKGGTWIPVGTRKAGVATLTGWWYQDFYCPAPVPDTGQVIATKASAAHCGIYAAEYSGFTGTPTLDGHAYKNGVSTGFHLGTSAAISTVANSCVIALGVFPEPGIVSISGPFTDRAPGGFGNWDSCGVGDYIVTSTQSALSADYELTAGVSDDITGILAIADGAPTPPPASTAVAADIIVPSIVLGIV